MTITIPQTNNAQMRQKVNTTDKRDMEIDVRLSLYDGVSQDLSDGGVTGGVRHK